MSAHQLVTLPVGARCSCGKWAAGGMDAERLSDLFEAHVRGRVQGTVFPPSSQAGLASFRVV
jgi:hypothetical protein